MPTTRRLGLRLSTAPIAPGCMSSAPDADVATRSQRPEPPTPLNIHPASPDCLQVRRRPSSPLLRVYAHIFLPPVCAAACTPTPKSRRRLTIPPAPIRRLQFTDCMLKGRRRRKLNTQRCSTLPAPIPRLRFTDCIMLSAPDTLTLTPPYNFACVLAISCDYRSRTHEHVERVCPLALSALGISLSLLPPFLRFLALPASSHPVSPLVTNALRNRIDPSMPAGVGCPSHPAFDRVRAIFITSLLRLGTRKWVLLPSTSTLFPSRLNTHPALLASGRLPRLATSPYDRARYATGRAPSSHASRDSPRAGPPTYSSEQHSDASRKALRLGSTDSACKLQLTHLHSAQAQTYDHARAARAAPSHLHPFLSFTRSLPCFPPSLPSFPPSFLLPSSSSIVRLVPLLPWSRSARADTNTTDVSSGVGSCPSTCKPTRGDRAHARARQWLQTRSCPLHPSPYPARSASPVLFRFSLRVVYPFICIPSPSKSDE
ncbi:hypothetical protein B0H14DRAFT_3513590 [Mycena olivaceomarginata]|nr:hypothetical protein B0H14DRAFT_3513590 [Mycena olivaceomarginata]